MQPGRNVNFDVYLTTLYYNLLHCTSLLETSPDDILLKFNYYAVTVL